jgi:ubiquinone/menaquinone biosynthesis C-methylase UbiE
LYDKRFDARFAHRLDDPERQNWLSPAEVVTALSVHEGEIIADIGAGTCYFSFPLAAAAGLKGKIYALDAQKARLDLLRTRISEREVKNIETVCAEGEHTGLPDGSCDMVFLSNVWHEFQNRSAILGEAVRILSSSGRIAILDWRPDVLPEHGPPLSHRIGASSAAAEVAVAGFERISFCNVGRYSWLIQGTLKPED